MKSLKRQIWRALQFCFLAAWLVVLWNSGTSGAGIVFSQKSDDQIDVKPIYGKYCQKCHGADGGGEVGRKLFPEIPDFTKRLWQKNRTDARLLVSILDGKGAGMPSFREKVSEQEAEALIVHLRGIAAPSGKGHKETQKDADPFDFEEKFRRLYEELDQLQRQFRELSEPVAAETADPMGRVDMK
jgi:mono/diheme cytochrome c family protein